jgi:RNA polymerase sigma-70 factor (ECF subfamily)
VHEERTPLVIPLTACGLQQNFVAFRVATTDDAVRPSSSTETWTALRAALARAVRRQCPAWLRDHAEDLAQAALMKVMAGPHAAEGERSLSSFYLYRVAHSALVDEIRRRQRRREIALDVQEPEADDRSEHIEPRASGNPEEAASLRELGTAVRGCLLAMKSERRLAVMLHIQGHSVPDAARLLGWDVKRTENLVYRGLADLRQCLLAKGHMP